MKQWEQDIQLVFDKLMQEPFEGSAWDLAKACGISYDAVNNVLFKVRKPEWLEEHHWTIPFVIRGADTNTWQIIDIEDKADNAVMRSSQNRRAEEMSRTTKRNIAQATLAMAAIGDGRVAAARHWRNVMVALAATEAHLELILSDNTATNGAS